MSDNNEVPYSVHVHFHGTPTPEFLEAFNRMLDIAAAAADSLILNGEIRESCEICPHCEKYKRLQGNGILHQLCECGT